MTVNYSNRYPKDILYVCKKKILISRSKKESFRHSISEDGTGSALNWYNMSLKKKFVVFKLFRYVGDFLTQDISFNLS